MNKIKKALNIIFQPINIKKFNYNELYKDYDKKSGSIDRANVIKPYIKKDKTILDIGCGSGEFLKEFKDNHLYGIEISKEACKLSISNGVICHVKDLSKEGQEIDGVYDYITMNMVLEHIQNAEDIILKAKGKFREELIISVPNIGFILFRLRFLFGSSSTGTMSDFCPYSEHVRIWSHKDFLYWLDKLGFKVTRIKINGKVPFQYLWKNMFAKDILYFVKEK